MPQVISGDPSRSQCGYTQKTDNTLRPPLLSGQSWPYRGVGKPYSPSCREQLSLLKNSSVPFSDPRSEAENPGLWLF